MGQFDVAIEEFQSIIRDGDLWLFDGAPKYFIPDNVTSHGKFHRGELCVQSSL